MTDLRRILHEPVVSDRRSFLATLGAGAALAVLGRIRLADAEVVRDIAGCVGIAAEAT